MHAHTHTHTLSECYTVAVQSTFHTNSWSFMVLIRCGDMRPALVRLGNVPREREREGGGGGGGREEGEKGGGREEGERGRGRVERVNQIVYYKTL